MFLVYVMLRKFEYVWDVRTLIKTIEDSYNCMKKVVEWGGYVTFVYE